ncbi:Envelope glycoprotein, partial [Lemmus lemmus]
TTDRLLNLIKGAYQALNHSDPDWIKACWLCLNPSPPYYEGIAFMGNFSNHTQPPESCRTDHRLTLTHVAGSSLCIGRPSPSISNMCNTTLHVPTDPTGIV